MIPVRNVGDFIHEGEKITLLIPKFKSKWMLKWLIPPRRSKHFRIHLDTTGSKVWELINGESNTGDICLLIKSDLSVTTDISGKIDQSDMRVREFLRQLYKHRFIIFK